ncbi:cell division protein FtsN [Paenibacillus rhizovicinus]|uniref:Cell division protein FtsN n=1 Tax=Paenibacillus rhizovicinus TaxID=2704463 RepID=A0A6C0NZY2_9BACL|nr:TasA family protein [Paenibacillus rhizovicinus]QHW31516.1 cell division protein FtsN [Paenibacillus rhizovicinus]
MSIKVKLGLGLATAALGLSLIGGGTFAYFSDTAVKTGTFAAGNVDLNVGTSQTETISFANLAPGDHMTKTFKLNNDGSLDIGKIYLSTKYTVQDNGIANSEDLGKYIKVEFLRNIDKSDQVVESMTLYDLLTRTPDAAENTQFDIIQWLAGHEEAAGLKSHTSDSLIVRFTFEDNGQNQDQFQNDALNLQWSFEARTTGVAPKEL